MTLQNCLSKKAPSCKKVISQLFFVIKTVSSLSNVHLVHSKFFLREYISFPALSSYDVMVLSKSDNYNPAKLEKGPNC